MNKVHRINKAEAYGWRPSARLKKQLEAAAEAEGTSIDHPYRGPQRL